MINGINLSTIKHIRAQIKDKINSITAIPTVTINNNAANGRLSKSPKNGKLSLKLSHATCILFQLNEVK